MIVSAIVHYQLELNEEDLDHLSTLDDPEEELKEWLLYADGKAVTETFDVSDALIEIAKRKE